MTFKGILSFKVYFKGIIYLKTLSLNTSLKRLIRDRMLKSQVSGLGKEARDSF